MSNKASCWPSLEYPKLDEQIAQNESTLEQLKAAVQQAQANSTLAQANLDTVTNRW